MTDTTRHTLFILAGQEVGPLFIDTTDEFATRMRQQRTGRLSQSKHRLDRLVYVEEFDCAIKARRRADGLRAASIQWLSSYLLSRNPYWIDLLDAANRRAA